MAKNKFPEKHVSTPRNRCLQKVSGDISLTMQMAIINARRNTLLDTILKAIDGWTAGFECASAAANVVTVQLSGDAEFTDPDVGWTFQKFSAGQQLIGDIQFDNPLNASGVYDTSHWTDNSDAVNTYTSGGKLYFNGNYTAVSTQPVKDLVLNRTYNIVIDVDVMPSFGMFRVLLGATGGVAHDVDAAGISTFQITLTSYTSLQRIALVEQNGITGYVINSISIIEAEGDSETASAAVSTTTSPNDLIEFALTWVTNPTYGDHVLASYDSGVGDYADPNSLIAGATELSPDVGFDNSLAWSGLLIGTTWEVDGGTYPSALHMVDAVGNTGTLGFAIFVGQKLRITVDIAINTNGFRFMCGGGTQHEFPAGITGVFTVDTTVIQADSQAIGWSTYNLAQGSSTVVLNSGSIVELNPEPMDDTAIGLTNCLDAS